MPRRGPSGEGISLIRGLIIPGVARQITGPPPHSNALTQRDALNRFAQAVNVRCPPLHAPLRRPCLHATSAPTPRLARARSPCALCPGLTAWLASSQELSHRPTEAAHSRHCHAQRRRGTWQVRRELRVAGSASIVAASVVARFSDASLQLPACPSPEPVAHELVRVSSSSSRLRSVCCARRHRDVERRLLHSRRHCRRRLHLVCRDQYHRRLYLGPRSCRISTPRSPPLAPLTLRSRSPTIRVAVLVVLLCRVALCRAAERLQQPDRKTSNIRHDIRVIRSLI